MRQLETIFIVVLNNNILQNTGCYFIPEDFHTRSVLLHCKSFCLQTFQTQFSHGESELLLDNQEVTSAKTTSSNMSLERENFIQDLCIFYSFEVCLISDVTEMGGFTLMLFTADSDKNMKAYFLRQGFILKDMVRLGCSLFISRKFRDSVLTHNVSNNLLEKFCLYHTPELFSPKTSVLNEK